MSVLKKVVEFMSITSGIQASDLMESTFVPCEIVVEGPFPEKLPVIPDEHIPRSNRIIKAKQLDDSDRFDTLEDFMAYFEDEDGNGGNARELLIEAAFEALAEMDPAVKIDVDSEDGIPPGLCVVRRVCRVVNMRC